MSGGVSKQKEILSLLHNPHTDNPLKLENGYLKDPVTEDRFLIRDGIPIILHKNDVFGWNRKQQKSYDWILFLKKEVIRENKIFVV